MCPRQIVGDDFGFGYSDISTYYGFDAVAGNEHQRELSRYIILDCMCKTDQPICLWFFPVCDEFASHFCTLVVALKILSAMLG